MWLGTMKHRRSKILEFKSMKPPVKILGTLLSYNQNRKVEENFVNRITKMKTKLNLLLCRDLTLYGKSLSAKALGVSQLIFAVSLLSVPTSVIKNVQAELFNFLWKNKIDKRKRLVMHQPLYLLSMGIVYIIFKSLRTKIKYSRTATSCTGIMKRYPWRKICCFGNLGLIRKSFLFKIS